MDHLSILLSRIQMAVTLSMHIIWPSLNIGLALFLCVMEAIWLKTKNPIYLKICKYWMKIFALAFGMGVVSGVVMSYELGTNFGNFTNAIGEVLGSLFVYEVLTAFFVEAGFLGIMLFGWNRVSPKMHFLATFMVMFGTFLSAFWIMSANSWMQTPAGTHMVGSKFVIDSWINTIFNPSLVHRFTHMVLASYVTCIFFIAGISAWYLLKQRYVEAARKCFSIVMWAALILVPIQLFIGDEVGLTVHQYQPIKTAAIEGVWNTQRGAPLLLFAIPDSKQQKNLFPIKIPHLASFINTHEWNGKLVGLKSVPPKDQPVVLTTFFGFRIMVGIGLLMLLAALLGAWYRYKGTLYDKRWFLWCCVAMTPFGAFATIAGWFTAETGRQPWVVYNLLRTAQGASNLAPEQVAISLSAFTIIYTIAIAFFVYYFVDIVRTGPDKGIDEEEKGKKPSVVGYMHGAGE